MEETQRYLWDKTRSCSIDCQWSRTLCDKVPRPEWFCTALDSSFFSKQTNLQCHKAHLDTKPSQNSLTKEQLLFCLLITTQFKAVAHSFLLWDAQVHKYWLNCFQIIRITNANPVVDLALVLPLISAWHSWKVAQLPQEADRKSSVNCGSGSLCNVVSIFHL